MNIFQKVAKFFEPPAGVVHDALGEKFPAEESMSGAISPISSHIPGMEYGMALPLLVPAVLGYDVHLRDGDEEQRKTLSEEGREQLLAEFEAQIAAEGKITKFPDLNQFDDSPPSL
jgi:hypothetical protein